MTVRLTIAAAMTAILSLIGLMTLPAFADETVTVGGAQAVLIKPHGAAKGSLILMAGGNGQLNIGPGGAIGSLKGNQVVRTRHAYAERGFAVLVPDANINLAAAVKYMDGIAKPVTVVGTSRGTQRAAEGIGAGARPDALVLTSGFLSPQSGQGVNRHVIKLVGGSPNVLPRTLVIHHRHDGCHFTQPSGVQPFLDWAKGKASVVWLDGGANNGDPCQAGGHHGFAGLDNQVVDAVVKFAAK
ncbi:MAG TPA: alpha/beta hydrolase [Pseudolabrys sp.]|nr:alpha/beta hydrolase [Pseudolabrys sp.]